MRALAGPVMLLVIVGGVGLHRALTDPDSPSRDFLDRELAGPQGQPGSCYSLSTVLIANLMMGPTREWKPAHEGAWTLVFEDLQGSGAGPRHFFQRFTFEKRGEMVHLVDVETVDWANADVTDNLEGLLLAPNQRRSTPVERCAQPGAQGFNFRLKNARSRR